MADWQNLKDEVDDRANKLHEKAAQIETDIVQFRDEMVMRIEAAKNDDVLKALATISARLDRIEQKLAEEENPLKKN